MNLSVGIAGLPNVGKSTLFNALLKKQQALVANYPFATIEPNVGVVAVPDERLAVLARIISEQDTKILSDKSPNIPISQYLNIPPIVPAVVRFVDIAGLVKGASEGAGLGNKFLSHIREVSVIAHVVRAFEDPSAGSGQVPILREGSVDPKTDYENIRTELQIADLQTLQNLSEKALKTDPVKKAAVEKLKQTLDEGKNVSETNLTNEEKVAVKELNLLTSKPEIIVLNVSEENYSEEKFQELVYMYTSLLGVKDEKMVVISAKIEAELAALSEDEQKEYLKDLGLEFSGLERLIQKAYEELGLISFLTAPASADASARQGGKWEVRAWTLRRGSTALIASGEIHTDFAKKFIKAEVISFEDFVQYDGWKGSREHGKARLEGRDYIVKDGDIVEFKIGS